MFTTDSYLDSRLDRSHLLDGHLNEGADTFTVKSDEGIYLQDSLFQVTVDIFDGIVS
jgi:hypothetical protein